jgi:hypothetical protein
MQVSDEMREAAHRVLWERDQVACTPATVTAALEAALSATEPVCCGRPVYEGSPEAYTLECCRKLIQPAPIVAAKILELDGVPDALAYGKGIWRTCTGCHESNEGYPTGPFSDTLKCHLGGGCFECGGIGAVWDTTDYEDMGNFIALSAQVQDLAGDQSTVEADGKLLEISKRLIKWDTDFPVNGWNGYAGLKELDKIIADAKVAVHGVGASCDNEFGANHPPADGVIAGSQDDDIGCPICSRQFKPDDVCATDIELGICHAECLAGAPVVDVNTGEPSDGPIDTYRYDSLDEVKPLDLNITKEWFEKRAALEGEHEIGAGRRKLTVSIDPTPEELAELHRLAHRIPDGWQLVPIEPTQEMCEAPPSLPSIHAIDDLPLKKSGWSMSAIVNRKRYLAMLAASPTKQEG